MNPLLVIFKQGAAFIEVSIFIFSFSLHHEGQAIKKLNLATSLKNTVTLTITHNITHNIPDDCLCIVSVEMGISCYNDHSIEHFSHFIGSTFISII